MAFFDGQDWKDWIHKVKWLLISFKFMSFCMCVALLIAAWFSIWHIFMNILSVLERLVIAELLDRAQAGEILTKSLEILYDKALSHILLFLGSIMASIIAIKGVSYWVNERQVSALVGELKPVKLKKQIDKILKR